MNTSSSGSPSSSQDSSDPIDFAKMEEVARAATARAEPCTPAYTAMRDASERFKAMITPGVFLSLLSRLKEGADTIQAAQARIKVLEGALIEARGELFDLCEHTGDECLIKIRAACDGDVVHPGKEHELGFYRGRYSEAKAISRSMGDVFRDLLARSALPQVGGESG